MGMTGRPVPLPRLRCLIGVFALSVGQAQMSRLLAQGPATRTPASDRDSAFAEAMRSGGDAMRSGNFPEAVQDLAHFKVVNRKHTEGT